MSETHYAPPLPPPNWGAGYPLHVLTPEQRAEDRIDADAAHATCRNCIRLLDEGHDRLLPVPAPTEPTERTAP